MTPYSGAMAGNAVAPETDVLAAVSHELRAPLASIRLAARALVDGDVPEAQRAKLEQLIALEAEHLARLVGDLDSETPLDVEAGPCDAVAVVYGVAEAAALRAPQGVTVQIGHVRGLAPVMADPDRLRQVLVNLVENAIAYSPPGGSVLVTAEYVPGYVRFAVEDEGPGVPEAERELIFEPFYGRRPGGTGLGLYLSREIVARMGGRIWAESRATRTGGRFVFELPPA